jgi:hypothetical protein
MLMVRHANCVKRNLFDDAGVFTSLKIVCAETDETNG